MNEKDVLVPTERIHLLWFLKLHVEIHDSQPTLEVLIL